MPEKEFNEHDLGSGNQSDIALRSADKFFGGPETSTIGEVVSQIKWPLTFPSRATSQEFKETQGEWFLTYFCDNSLFDRTGNDVLVKIPLQIFGSHEITEAVWKGRQEFSNVVKKHDNEYDKLMELHKKGEYAHPPKSAFERGPSNMSIVYELSTTGLVAILDAAKIRSVKK